MPRSTNEWVSPQEVHLRSLLQVAEHSLSVTYLAEMNLEYIPPTSTVGRAVEWLSQEGFDAAPIDEPSPHRFIAQDARDDPSALVGDVAPPIDTALLATASLSLADGIELLRERAFYFVFDGRRLVGIVTRADLQRPSVSMVVFSLILAIEAAIDRIIEARLGPDWMGHLSETARERTRKIHATRARYNAEISMLACLTLPLRLDLFEQCPGALGDVGFDGDAAFASWKRTIRDLRNPLAHGQGILAFEPDPVRAIEVFRQVRSFAEGCWSLVERVDPIDVG